MTRQAMTARWCPTGRRACTAECVNHLADGCLLDREREHSLAEIATEQGVGESQIRRDEASLLAKFRAEGLDIDVLADRRAAEIVRNVIATGLRQQFARNYSSSGNPGFLRVPRRFSAKSGDGQSMPRASASSPIGSSPVGAERGAGLLSPKEPA
jgi:hypothetical protein